MRAAVLRGGIIEVRETADPVPGPGQILVQARASVPIEVPSPTFTLVQTYELPSGLISHFDLYRLNDASDAYELGLDDAFGGITLIEWPERLGDGLPRDPLIIDFAPADAPDARKISLQGGTSWAGRLDFLRLKF